MAIDIDSIKVEITLKDIRGEEKKISSMQSLNSFLQGEFAFWQGIRGKWKFEPVNQIFTQVNAAMGELNNFKTNFEKFDESQQSQQLRSIQNKIQQAFAKVSFSDTPFTIALVAVCNLGQTQTLGFWNYVVKQGNGQLPANHADYIEGLLYGYEFKNQDESLIYKRSGFLSRICGYARGLGGHRGNGRERV